MTANPFDHPPTGPRIFPLGPDVPLWIMSSTGSPPIPCSLQSDGSILGSCAMAGHGYNRLVTFVNDHEVMILGVSLYPSEVHPGNTVTIRTYELIPR